MTKLCIYHANCADGFTSAWAVWKRYPDTEFHEGFYGTPPPDCTDREVVLVDFSYKRDVLLEMAAQAESILILDHHKSAEAELVDLPDNVTTVFDMNRSGAMISWEYYHDEIPPVFVEHVQDRDLWRFKVDGTRAFQANVFSYEYTFENWERINEQSLSAAGHWDFIKQGLAIERKHFKDIKELIKTAAMRDTIDGYDVWQINQFSLCALVVV